MSDPVFKSYEIPDIKSKSNKLLIAILIVILILSVASFSFLFGKLSRQSDNSSSGEFPDTDVFKSTTSNLERNKTPTLIASVSGAKKSPTPSVKTKIISGTESLDGYRASDNSGNNASEIKIGRNINNVTRGFVSFELSEIPQGVKITEATLRLYQVKTVGSPYGAGKALKIDHLTIGNILDASDYGMAALLSSFTTISTNSIPEWKEINVTDRVIDDLTNARSTSQFRIHFQSESTGGTENGDYVFIESSEDNLKTGNTPELLLKYY